MSMSKFVKIAVANSEEETAEANAIRVQPILKAKLEAKMKAQEAVIIEKGIQLKEADATVEASQGYATTNVDNYLDRLFSEMTERDQIAEDLKNAETLLEELKSTLVVFA